MRENSANLGVHLFRGPFGMMCANCSGFQSARKPIKLLGKLKSTSGGHALKNFDLFRAGLFVGKHRSKSNWRRKQREQTRSLGLNPVRGCLIIETTATLPNFLFVFRRREMRNPVIPTTRLRLCRRVETAEPPPPKNKKEIIFWATLLYQQATPNGVFRMCLRSLLPPVHFFHPSKLLAFANASSSFATSLPPPRALSGRPPPLPPTMGAMVWMILPA